MFMLLTRSAIPPAVFETLPLLPAREHRDVRLGIDELHCQLEDRGPMLLHDGHRDDPHALPVARAGHADEDGTGLNHEVVALGRPHRHLVDLEHRARAERRVIEHRTPSVGEHALLVAHQVRNARTPQPRVRLLDLKCVVEARVVVQRG